MDHIAASLGVPWHGVDTDDPAVLAALSQIREHAVAAKEALSSDVEATVPIILPGTSTQVRITRGELEDAIREPLLRTVELLRATVTTSPGSSHWRSPTPRFPEQASPRRRRRKWTAGST